MYPCLQIWGSHQKSCRGQEHPIASTWHRLLNVCLDTLKKKKGDYRRLGDLGTSKQVTMLGCNDALLCVWIKRKRTFAIHHFQTCCLSLHRAPSQLMACDAFSFLWLFKIAFQGPLFATKERASSRHNSFFLIPSINEM